MMDEGINWASLRARIALTPVVVKPKHVKHPNRSPESLERRKEGARVRSKRYYWNNRDKELQRQREWEMANPDKVRDKRRRSYEKCKQDPEWLERKRARQREWKRRKKQGEKVHCDIPAVA